MRRARPAAARLLCLWAAALALSGGPAAAQPGGKDPHDAAAAAVAVQPGGKVPYNPAAAAVAVQPQPGFAPSTVVARASLSISAAPSRITPGADGQRISYSLIVANRGRAAATNVHVTLLRDSQPMKASAAGACRLVPCTIESIAPGGQSVIQVTQPASGAPFVILASATMPSDPTPRNNETRIVVAAAPSSAPAYPAPANPAPANPPPASSAPPYAPAPDPPRPTADLFISATPATLTPGSAGQAVPYTVVVSNRGPNAATNVQVSAYIARREQHLTAGGDCNYLPCTIGVVPAGGSRTIRVSQPIADPAGFAVQLATAGQQTDPVPQNNVATVMVAAAPPPPDQPRQRAQTADLSISVASTAVRTEGPNRLVTYTVTVDNAGPDAATGVRVDSVVNGQAQTGSASGDCAALPCLIDTIPSGATKVAAFSQWIALDGTVDLALQAFGRQSDPNPGDNRTGFRVGPPKSTPVAPAPVSSAPAAESSAPPSTPASSPAQPPASSPAVPSPQGPATSNRPPPPPPPAPWWRQWPLRPPSSVTRQGLPIGLALAVAAAGLVGLRSWRRRRLKAWLNRTSVTADLAPTPDGHSGPLAFRAPPVGLAVHCAPGEGGPRSAVPILKVVKT